MTEFAGYTRNESTETRLIRIEMKLDKLLAKKKPVKPRSSKVEYSTVFENRAWRIYPNRVGSNPKKRAYNAWEARISEGALIQDMVWGLACYADFCGATGKTGTEYVMQAATFFGPDKHYENDWTIPAQADNVPTKNDEICAWAKDKGYREAYPGETNAAYRTALERLHRSE